VHGRSDTCMYCSSCSQSRATGIDKLARAVQDVPEATLLESDLPAFVGFLNTLILDPNFKIALSSLQILGTLTAKAGRAVEPLVRWEAMRPCMHACMHA
jgi:hypothetical protein